MMAVAGAYLLTNQVTVTTNYWQFWGVPAFGLTLVPLILGIGKLAFNGKSILGWLLTLGGAVIIFAGILMHLDIYFRPTSPAACGRRWCHSPTPMRCAVSGNSA